MAKTLPKGTIEIVVKLRGEPRAVVKALANGLPLEALEGIHEGMKKELAKRERNPARGRRPVRITVSNRARKGSKS